MIASELQNRINQATKEIDRNYQLALAELRELKEKINDLELVIVNNEYAKTSGDKEELDAAIDKLVKFTDFMIAKSERAWEEYRMLEQDCRIDASESSDVNGQMKALMDLCKRTDEFASDLLCYSLAHFKPRATSKP